MNYNDIFRGKDIYSNLFVIPLLGKHQNINIGILFRNACKKCNNRLHFLKMSTNDNLR